MVADLITYQLNPSQHLLGHADELLEKYPYCKELWLMKLLQNTNQQQDFDKLLNKTAIRFYDRSLLRSMVNHATWVTDEVVAEQTEKIIEEKEVLITETSDEEINVPAENAIPEPEEAKLIEETTPLHTENGLKETVDDTTEVEIKPAELAADENKQQSFMSWLEEFSTTEIEQAVAENTQDFEVDEKNIVFEDVDADFDKLEMQMQSEALGSLGLFESELSDNQIYGLNSFIQNQIDKKHSKSQLQSPKPEMVSENLAKLLLKQGKTQRAIEIYQKLALIIPAKSSYFAAQIEKIEKNLL